MNHNERMAYINKAKQTHLCRLVVIGVTLLVLSIALMVTEIVSYWAAVFILTALYAVVLYINYRVGMYRLNKELDKT